MLVPRALPEAAVAALRQALERVGNDPAVRVRGAGAYAIRNVLQLVPEAAEWVHSPAVRMLVEPLLGPEAFPVKATLFDKTSDANWHVGWHQDVTIAVRQRREVPGFRAWSEKAGVPHVQPPAEVLERMVALRLHLDPCGEENGALRVIPGSHRAGRLSSEEIQGWIESRSAVPCPSPAGGALLMRPLLLHASSPALRPEHRRVLHVEFAAEPLPGGLEWCREIARS